MACCGTRSRVDGPEACTVCLEPLPLPGPGGDCVLVLHACGHAFHRDCAQDFLLDALRRRRTPRCPNCRATLHTAPFGKLLGQRKLPRSRRMKNMRQLITVSEVRRLFYPLFPNRRPRRFLFLPRDDAPRRRVLALTTPFRRRRRQEYMKHKNWRVPRRNPTGTSEQQRALAGLIIQSRKEFKEEFGEEP